MRRRAEHAETAARKTANSRRIECRIITKTSLAEEHNAGGVISEMASIILMHVPGSAPVFIVRPRALNAYIQVTSARVEAPERPHGSLLGGAGSRISFAT